MSENKNSSKINEFDFEDDSVKDKVIDQSMVGGSKMPINNSVVALVVTVTILVGVVRMFSGSSPAKVATLHEQVKVPIAPVQPTVAAKPVVAPTADLKLGTPPPAPAKTPLEPMTDSNVGMLKDLYTSLDKVAKLQTTVSESLTAKLDEFSLSQKTSVSDLQTQIKKLQTQLSALNDSQKEYKDHLLALMVAAQDNDKKLMHIDTLLTKQAAEFDVAEDLKAMKPLPKLMVHAVIPGRAWLRDQNNKIFSVVEGEDILGYGKVLTIDPRLGTVVTNSGQILRY